MMRGRVRNCVHVGTWLWQQHSQEMNSVMARHDSLLTSAVEANGGTVVRPREVVLRALSLPVGAPSVFLCIPDCPMSCAGSPVHGPIPNRERGMA